ncbi:MAG: hypothetical protein QM779_02635 [Propionicimonas sp.]|uniref:hypothetical protein n=1 Tax=Propionicimonas sp. TaxID=1955623 RepID=UPI003D0DD0C6
MTTPARSPVHHKVDASAANSRQTVHLDAARSPVHHKVDPSAANSRQTVHLVVDGVDEGLA